MSKLRGAAPVEEPADSDPELAEFVSLEPAQPADPEFREALRAELWALLEALRNR